MKIDYLDMDNNSKQC